MLSEQKKNFAWSGNYYSNPSQVEVTPVFRLPRQ